MQRRPTGLIASKANHQRQGYQIQHQGREHDVCSSLKKKKKERKKEKKKKTEIIVLYTIFRYTFVVAVEEWHAPERTSTVFARRDSAFVTL